MSRIGVLLLLVVAMAMAGSAGPPPAVAKEPAVVHSTAELAVVGGEIQQPKLAWLQPKTLKQLKRGVVKLPGAFAVVMSPTRARAIAGSGGVGLEIVNVKQMKRVGQLARRAGWSVHPISWPVANRVFALEWNDRLGQTLLVADPVSRRPVKRISSNGFSTWVRAGNGVVAVGGPTDGIGPARLLAVDRNGNARTVVLERVQAGGRMEGTEEEPTYRTASPGLAFDSATGHVYVVGQAPLVADIDLATLAVTYRELSPPRSLLGRFLEWLQPAARGKIVNGWHRQVVALGEGKLAVAGSDYDRLRRSPSGLDLVDVPSGTMRRLEGRASYALVASGMLLVAGDQGTGDGTWTGMGLAAYTLDGEKLWHALDGEPVSWAQTAGGYAYVAGKEAYPPTVRVIDLAGGETRTLRGQLPFFITP